MNDGVHMKNNNGIEIKMGRKIAATRLPNINACTRVNIKHFTDHLNQLQIIP